MMRVQRIIQALMLTLILFLIPNITAALYAVFDIYILGNIVEIFGSTAGANFLGQMITAVMITFVPCIILGIGNIATVVIRNGIDRSLVKVNALLNIFIILVFFIINNVVIGTSYSSQSVGTLFKVITTSTLFVIPTLISSRMIFRSV